MTRYLPIIIASGLLAFLATPLTRLLARQWGMVDQPGLRKAHRSPVPLLGGLAMYVAVALTLIAFGIEAWLIEGVGILGGATLLFITGLWDDRFGMPVRLKLAAQTLAAVCLIAVGIQVRLFDRWWLDWPITLLWVVGITNAANLMDNMDGLTAGVSAVGAAFFFVMAALEGQGLVASLAAALLGASLGFLFYNFAPAVSFMGDAGALMLGFLLAALGIKIRFLDYPLGATWMAPIVVLGVLIFDTTLVVSSRLRRGRPVSQGASDHTSHRLVQLGLSHPRAVLTIYVAAAGLGATALFLTRSTVAMSNLAFVALIAVGLLALWMFERVEPKLSGDPPVVLIPGGGGFSEALRAARVVSQDLTVLLAPRRIGGEVLPPRLEVVEIIAALCDEPEAARGLLARGLGDAWWRDVDTLPRLLRLKGGLLAVCDSPLEALPALNSLTGNLPPDVLAAFRRAKVIVLGPGDPEINLTPVLSVPGVRAAIASAHGLHVWAGDPSEAVAHWPGEAPIAVPTAELPQWLQARLLSLAAAQAKTQSG